MTRTPRTVRQWIDWGAKALSRRGLDDLRFESELLLAHALGSPRLGLLTLRDARLSDEVARRFVSLIVRRRRREPAAYLLGRCEFYSIDFVVGPGVLVPRPETEHLVERAIERAKSRGGRVWALDVGTGSGAIAVAFAINVPGARVIAIDRSEAALRYASINARHAGVSDRVTFLVADLVDLRRLFRERTFDLILSNPPYVAADLVRDETAHEPSLALVGNSGEFPSVYQRLVAARALLREGGALMMEVGYGQAATVAAIATEGGSFARVDCENDLAGVPRVVIAEDAGV